MAPRDIDDLGPRQFNNYLRDLIALDDDNRQEPAPINDANEVNHGQPIVQGPIHIDDFIDNYFPQDNQPHRDEHEGVIADNPDNIDNQDADEPAEFDFDPGQNGWIPPGPYDHDADRENNWNDIGQDIQEENDAVPQYQINFERNINEDDNAPNLGADEVDHDYGNLPLYDNADITIGQSNLILMALQTRYNLSQVCLEEIMKAIELHCPQRGLNRNSLYKYNRYFNLQTSKFTKHFYCSTCLRELANDAEICPACPRKKNSYFVEMPFIEHLTEMYKREGFYDNLMQRFNREVQPGTIEDIYDGALYKDLEARGILGHRNTISFTLYVDGIPVFKSSKVSFTPIYCTINEMTTNARKDRENTLVLGLWFGAKKPHMSTFLGKFRPKIEELAAGIPAQLSTGERIIINGVIIAWTCDLPARCDLLNITQFNGKCGCPGCFEEGISYRTGPRSCVHVYPYKQEGYQTRTTILFNQYADQALQDGQPVRGVKGPSVHSRLLPDYIRGMGVDRMHGIDGGGMKKLLMLWFHTTFRGEQYSLHAEIDNVNSRLLRIKPPKFVHRMPRDVRDLIHWKASELKIFLFYYAIPVFSGIMSDRCLRNFLCLVVASMILSKESITEMMINVAEDLLSCFVREFQEIYGPRHCSINIHQLQHLCDCVRNLGPLWVYSCYEYEDLNGKLLNAVHGTRQLDTQIANSQSRYIKMPRLIEALDDGDIKNFCLDRKKQVKIIEAVGNHAYSVRAYKSLDELKAENRHTLVNILHANNINEAERLLFYCRLLKNEKLYVSEMYGRILQTLTSAVRFKANGNTIKYGMLSCFMKRNGHHFAIIDLIQIQHVYKTAGDYFQYDTTGFLYICRPANESTIISINDLISPCFYMQMENGVHYIAIPINHVELE